MLQSINTMMDRARVQTRGLLAVGAGPASKLCTAACLSSPVVQVDGALRLMELSLVHLAVRIAGAPAEDALDEC